MITKKIFLILACFAICIKIFLFLYAEQHVPEAKFQIDTEMYLDSGMVLAEHGVFARKDSKGSLHVEIFRTPGYPLFLGLLRGVIHIPFTGIVFIQILLTIAVACAVYRIAKCFNPNLAYVSALIVLFDLPITIFSLMLLTETLFLFFITLFVYVFVCYMKTKKLTLLLVAAAIVGLATYIRPINYFFGIAIGIFIFYLAFVLKQKKLIVHALVFLLLVYGIIGLWHVRNKHVLGINTFSAMTLTAASYRQNYRDDDIITRQLPPALYYLNAYSRCLMSLMTEPGTLKEFNQGALKFWAKVFGYLWVVFWLIGFLAGVAKAGKNYYYHFFLCVIGYFICASIGGALFGVGYRLRVPMVPCIALVSAYGWSWIAAHRSSSKGKKFPLSGRGA